MIEKKTKSGFSLIEIMVALLLLLVLLIGGSMVMFSTGADIQIYGNKRVALELARTEMEGLLATDYATLRVRAIAGNPETGSRSETWNEIPLAINWTNRLVSSGGILDVISGGSLDNEYIELDVGVSYRGAGQTVLLHATKTITP